MDIVEGALFKHKKTNQNLEITHIRKDGKVYLENTLNSDIHYTTSIEELKLDLKKGEYVSLSKAQDFGKDITFSNMLDYLNAVKPHDGGLDALTNMLDYELYSKINWEAPNKTDIGTIKELVKEINSNKEIITKNINNKKPFDHIERELLSNINYLEAHYEKSREEYLSISIPEESHLDYYRDKHPKYYEALTNEHKMEISKEQNWLETKENEPKIGKELADFWENILEEASGISNENENSKTNVFSLNDIPFEDFKKLGIDKNEFLNRSKDLEKLLSGEKTNSISINKFDNIDITVKLELKQTNNNIELIVTPDKMELKNEYQKNIDKFLKLDGVVENSTEKLNILIKDNSSSIKLLNEEKFDAKLKEFKALFPEAKEKEILPDTWLKVESEIAKTYKEKYNIPVVKQKNSFHIGLILKGIDKHSFKQSYDALKAASLSINKNRSFGKGVGL